MDRLYPNSSQDINHKSRFGGSFREVFKDTITEEFPDLLSKIGLKKTPSLEERVNLAATGYVVTIPTEHLKRLQQTPFKSKQEKLYDSYNSSAKGLKGSLVNMTA